MHTVVKAPQQDLYNVVLRTVNVQTVVAERLTVMQAVRLCSVLNGGPYDPNQLPSQLLKQAFSHDR